MGCIKALAQADLHGLYIPEEYGGFGGGVFEYCLAVEELSKVCAGIAVSYAASGLGTFPYTYYLVQMNKRKNIYLI